MSKRKAIAILAIIAMVLTLMPAAMFGATNVDRLAGANRIETALKICDAGWKSADTVILAAADEANLVDALAAGPLAAQENAPILVTYKNSLNADVKAKIAALGAKKVIVVGAVSDSVVEELKAIAGVTVEKISGKNRIETANLINAKLKNVAGTFVVGYLGLPDALSVASYAAANNFAIAIAKADGTVNEDSLLGETTYIVGGTARVADIDGATRFAGSDRLATNAAVAEGLEFDFGKVYVANGRTLVDALAVAPLAAKTDSFVLLVEANKGKAVEGMTASTQIIAVGGTAAVPQKVLDNLFGEDDGEFTIKSVKAPNLIQLKLELSNTNYDKDELTNENNYYLEAIIGSDKEPSNVDVKKASVKDTTLTLTLTTPIKNETRGTLTVDSSVTGEELVFEDIQFSDHAIPEIEEVKVIGKDTVKFIFSEPINFWGENGTEFDSAQGLYNTDLEEEFDFELDGSSYSVKELNPIKDGKEVNVVVYDNFKEGDLTVKVGNGLEDYAGFNIIPKTFEVDVVEDTDAPYVVGYKDAKRDQVTLIFNEDISIESNKESDFYHTNDKNPIDNMSDLKLNGNELTIKFDDAEKKLPEGTAYVYIKSGAVADLWDNENDFIKVKVQIDEDNIKPEVKKVEWKDSKIIVTYSEAMDSSAKDRDNYTLVDPDDDKVTIKDAAFAKDSEGKDNTKKVEIELRSNNPDPGTYELTIDGVEDKAGNKIAKVTVEVKISDSKKLEYVTKAYYDESGSKYRLYLEFGEELAKTGNYSVLDLFKYEVTKDNGVTWDNLGDMEKDDDVYAKIDLVDNGKTVRITTDYRFATVSSSDDTIDPSKNFIKIVGRIADAAGNYTTEPASGNIEILPKAGATINIVEANAKSSTTLEVVFDGPLTSYDPKDFLIWTESSDIGNAAKALAVKSVEKGSSATKAIITLVDKKDNKFPADPSGYTLGTRTTTKSKNATGRTLVAGLGKDGENSGEITIRDKIAPGVAKLDDQEKSSTTPDTSGTGKSDGVNLVWAETKLAGTDESGNQLYDSQIYIQFNEEINDVTYVSNPSGFTVTVDGKKVPVGKLSVKTVDGVFGPATGVKSLLVIKISGYEAAVMAGDTIDIGNSVIFDVDSEDQPNNAAGAFALSIEYKVPTITGDFAY